MQSCPQCSSQRIVPGRVIGGGTSVGFRPDNLRVLALTLRGGVPLHRQSLACRDCGLIWSFADKQKLNSFLKKYCDGLDDDPTT